MKDSDWWWPATSKETETNQKTIPNPNLNPVFLSASLYFSRQNRHTYSGWSTYP